jgi:hypothetical protein
MRADIIRKISYLSVEEVDPSAPNFLIDIQFGGPTTGHDFVKPSLPKNERILGLSAGIGKAAQEYYDVEK